LCIVGENVLGLSKLWFDNNMLIDCLLIMKENLKAFAPYFVSSIINEFVAVI